METTSNGPSPEGSLGQHLKHSVFWLTLVGMLLLAGVVTISLLREKIVNPIQNQVTVTGRGKVSYRPDTATVTLGVQIDKAPTAESALNQLNARINRLLEAEKSLVPEEKIQTQNYSLAPQYDFPDNRMVISGYSANQQITIKIDDFSADPTILSKVISAAGQDGVNQVLGVKFESSELEELKQQARIEAIQDAKARSQELARAAGVRLGKITSWYENILYSPDFQSYSAAYGMGGESGTALSASRDPQIPSGTQEIVIDLNVTYEVK